MRFTFQHQGPEHGENCIHKESSHFRRQLVFLRNLLGTFDEPAPSSAVTEICEESFHFLRVLSLVLAQTH